MKKSLLLLGLSLLSMSVHSQIQTQTRDNAGLQGNAGAMNGFFETSNPVNYPAGATGWWHLLDVRHTNTNNNFAMQLAGSFFDQNLYFRKTDNNASQQWSKILMMNPQGFVGIGTQNPQAKLDINFEGEPKSIKFIDAPNDLNTMNSILRFTWYNETADLGIVRSGSSTIEGFALRFNSAQTAKFLSNGTAIFNGSILSALGGNEGGSLGLINESKTGSAVKEWKIYNMTGGYGNSLQFWSYPANGTNYAARLKLSDSGDMALYGKFEAKEVKVTQTPTADFVFEEQYDLPKLEEVEKFIKAQRHLPDVASAEEMEKNGVNIGEFQIKLLQKIEELTLYTIEQHKKLLEQQERIEKLEDQLYKK